MNPYSWLTVFLFCAIATLLSTSFGWLVKENKLPSNSIMDFNDAQWQFMRVWVKIALLLGVIIPFIMWLAFWREPSLRQFFSCYLFVIAIQLASEIFLSRVLCKSVVVIVGTIYTGFRIWQLWSGLNLIAYDRLWFSLFLLVLFFWIVNMIMLIILAIPSLFPQLEKHS